MSDTQLAPRDTVTRHLLQALDGDKEALAWLDAHRHGLAVFTRALGNGKKGLESLRAMPPAEWDHLVETICNDGLDPVLEQRHPDVHLLFEAVKGDDGALGRLRRKKPSFGKLAEAIREYHEQYAAGGAEEAGRGGIPASAAADVGCLIGEMHLGKGEYPKAIEAFTRAIENQPTADAYQGRASAYRALADLDEQKARELKQG
jgi:tetratricopeptide (TPR) repeat protein